MNTPLRLALYALVVLAQLYVPASMIWSKETTLSEGTLIKMRCAPVDPYDPFRGRYVSLGFDETQVTLDRLVEFPSGKRKAYIVMENDADGFATIQDVVFEEPDDGLYYRADVQGYIAQGETQVTVYHPFLRYYMEEHAAPEAERVYRDVTWGGGMEAYAAIRVHNGDAVLEDLYLGDVPVSQIDLETLRTLGRQPTIP